MKIKLKDYRVQEGAKVCLGKWPTRVERAYKTKRHYHKLLDAGIAELSELQRLHYAFNRYSVLLIFQAMDAAGKGGAIRHVMCGVNPQGCQVFSFNHPTASELDHDFLWRTIQCLPSELFDEKTIWQQRYRSIVDLEAHLHRNRTRIIKFFLHLSPAEQRKRFLDRIDDPKKNWKFSLADIEERQSWKLYMKAYESCLGATSSKASPWYVVPADSKKTTRLIVSAIVLDTLKGLEMQYPVTDDSSMKVRTTIDRGNSQQGALFPSKYRCWGDSHHPMHYLAIVSGNKRSYSRLTTA
jgi:polyphosphate kinase 2 (PPK2 family)